MMKMGSCDWRHVVRVKGMETVWDSSWTDDVLGMGWWWLLFVGCRLLFGAQTDGGQGARESRKEGRCGGRWWSGSGRDHMNGKVVDGGLDDLVEHVHGRDLWNATVHRMENRIEWRGKVSHSTKREMRWRKRLRETDRVRLI